MNEEARRKAAELGVTPLDYMLGVLRDENETREVRMDAAKAAAPYLHAKLSSVEMKANVTNDKADEDLLAEVERLNAEIYALKSDK